MTEHGEPLRHGQLTCQRCFQSGSGEIRRSDWLLVNDPGYWGSPEPEVLVLGFSKGETQRRAMSADEFDTVAFKKWRKNILRILARIGLMDADTDIDSCFRRDEPRFGWASVLRCSVTKRGKGGTGIFVEAVRTDTTRRWVKSCIERWFPSLSPRTKLIVFFGITDSYIEEITRLLGEFYRTPGERLSQVHWKFAERDFIFVQHPSGVSQSHINIWVGNGACSKRELAKAAVKHVYEPTRMSAFSTKDSETANGEYGGSSV